jgi:P pilus assembly chaperone PapD
MDTQFMLQLTYRFHQFSPKNGFLLSIAFGLLFFVPAAESETSLSFSLEPMQAEFVLPNTSRTFTLRNLTGQTRTLQIHVQDRSETGDRETNKNTSELRVRESKMVLHPKSANTFVVEYRGPRDLKSERAYRLVVTDEADQLKPSGGGLKLSYRASIFVRDARHVPQVVLLSWKLLSAGRFEVVVQNQGQVHQSLSGLRLKALKADGGELGDLVFSEATLTTLQSQIVLSGSQKTLILEAVDRALLERSNQISIMSFN